MAPYDNSCTLLKRTEEDIVKIGVWSTVETGVGIMCACMPAVHSLFGHIAPKIFGSTQNSNNRMGGAGDSG